MRSLPRSVSTMEKKAPFSSTTVTFSVPSGPAASSQLRGSEKPFRKRKWSIQWQPLEISRVRELGQRYQCSSGSGIS
jgi:hypothetical protein